MKGLFLDPLKPLSTCTTAACEGCPLQSRLQCHFGGRELLRFFGIALPPFILGGIGITQVNAWLLLPWIGAAVAYFGFVEIRVMCSHCPHYAEPDSKSLQCWANYGSPKLWKYRPGPMTRNEKLVFFAGLVVIAGYPLAFLISSAQWLLLILLGISVAVNAAIMKRLMCACCINLACPFNGVDQATRASFFARNPVVPNTGRMRTRTDQDLYSTTRECSYLGKEHLMEITVRSTSKGQMVRPRLIRAAAIMQSLYALIEITDCIVALLMALGILGNYYPKMLFQEMQTLFDNQAAWLVPLFLFYTVLRVTSAIGLWRNRMWGFWLAIFVSTATLIMAPILLPFTSVEMLLNGILVIILLIGFFGDAPIFTPLKG